MRRQKGNLANWHGFGGGQLPMALVVSPEMQICTSEIAAVNPPMGGTLASVIPRFLRPDSGIYDGGS